MSAQLTTKDFIDRSLKVHGDKYDYSEVNYINCKIKVSIICKKNDHGIFEQTPDSHVRGANCPKCDNENRTHSFEDFLERALKIHGNKYNYDKVIYKKSNIKVTIHCPIDGHGDFEMRPSSHLGSKQGCPICGDMSKSTEEFIKDSQQVHGNLYDYSKVNYINSKTKVTIICLIPGHGEFDQLPTNHISKANENGCPKCAPNKKSSREEFIERSKKIHGEETYGYDQVVYITSKDKVIINCPKEDHGNFKQAPDVHLGQKQGCPICANEHRNDSSRLTIDEFILRAQRIHYNKNYDYSRAKYINFSTKVAIICYKHGEFWQTPLHHLDLENPTGCPKCSNFISKDQIKWLDYEKVPEEFRYLKLEINNRWFYPDAADIKNKIIWEFYGDYWHGNPIKYTANEENPTSKKTYGELYRTTIERENFLKEAGYTLVTIWESDWKKIKKELKKKAI